MGGGTGIGGGFGAGGGSGTGGGPGGLGTPTCFNPLSSDKRKKDAGLPVLSSLAYCKGAFASLSTIAGIGDSDDQDVS